MKTKERKTMKLCGYNLWCQVHGYKTALWSIDPPVTKKIVDHAWKKQLEEMTLPTHADCGTITLYDVQRVDTKNNVMTRLDKSYKKHQQLEEK